jgi:hypothetical protein
MAGFLFFTSLSSALTGFSMMSQVYSQKLVYYKHAASLFYPTSCLTLSQALVFFPLHVAEVLIFGSIMYLSAGLSSDNYGGRFFTFLLIVFTFAVTVAQMFRTVSFLMPELSVAAPIAGVILVLMVLFSGFILPKSQISDGWIWFYWINPVAWALLAVSVNQFKSSEYDFLVCSQYGAGGECVGSLVRFGDQYLTVYGWPTDQAWVWYAFATLLAMYAGLFVLSTLILKYLRSEAVPPPRPKVSDEEAVPVDFKELPFDPVTFAFRVRVLPSESLSLTLAEHLLHGAHEGGRGAGAPARRDRPLRAGHGHLSHGQQRRGQDHAAGRAGGPQDRGHHPREDVHQRTAQERAPLPPDHGLRGAVRLALHAGALPPCPVSRPSDPRRTPPARPLSSARPCGCRRT